MIKHIVFDFGGVILDLDGVHTGYPDNLAIIFNIPVKDAVQIWNENKTQVMTGTETPKEFLARMKEEHSFNFEVEKDIEYWEQQNIIDKNRIDWKLIEYIEQLSKNYQVHMLTDQIQLKNGASAWIDKINTHFQTILRSYEQGYRKPFAEAYHNLLTKIDATDTPDSVVFIDDNTGNVEAANKLGIHSILYTFKDHDSLKKSFEKLGIK